MLSSRMAAPLSFHRPPAVAAQAMVATSQPLATRAGLRALERGGNAVDAALAAAAVLCVTEPMSTGVGGDLFAQVWDGQQLHGLDAAGPAPLRADPESPVEETGPRSVTVPGAVAGWAALAERFGRLGLDAVLADAISAAEDGFAVAAETAGAWFRSHAAPRARHSARGSGHASACPSSARRCAGSPTEGPDAIYGGSIAEAIASCTWLDAEDLAGYRPRWVEPLTARLPGPHGLRATASHAGGRRAGGPRAARRSAIRASPSRWNASASRSRTRSRRCATAPTSPAYSTRTSWRRRRRDGSLDVAEPRGGTVYLCAVDGDRMAVSLIQSLYDSFGSGIVAPGTGIVLQNRGACFAVSGHVEPGRRPYHTIIPGMLLRDGQLLGPVRRHGRLPPGAGSRPARPCRSPGAWTPRLPSTGPASESTATSSSSREGSGTARATSRRSGCASRPSATRRPSAAARRSCVKGDVLLGGSDSRKDGYAAGF